MTGTEATASEIGRLLHRAQQGEQSALGKLLELHRAYLRLISDRYLFGGLKARVGSSDIVQQTCLSVHQRIREFNSESPEEFLAWLRQIHLNNIKNTLRNHLGTAKRSLTQEEESVATMIIADQSPQNTPSQRLMQKETAVILANALESLSESQREAIRLRFLEGLLLKEVAARMERSEPTVVGLIQRGLAKLKEILPPDITLIPS